MGDEEDENNDNRDADMQWWLLGNQMAVIIKKGEK